MVVGAPSRAVEMPIKATILNCIYWGCYRGKKYVNELISRPRSSLQKPKHAKIRIGGGPYPDYCVD
jgi:hypothetical protein